VSSTNVPPWFTGGGITTVTRERNSATLNPIITSVQYDFEQALDMQLLAGRSFSRVAGDRAWPDFLGALDGGEYGAVIDRSLARELGWSEPSAAAGQVFFCAQGGNATPVRILGVIEDKPLRLESLNGNRSNMYVLITARDGVVTIRLQRDQIAAGLAAIDAAWQRLAPHVPVQRKFMDEFFEEQFTTFALVGRLLTLMTVIGAGIAAMGLFAFALFVANRRAHEIGVRKTMGARTTQVLVMLLRDFSRPILWANVLVWPLAYIFAKQYLNTFVDRIDLDAWPFVLSLVGTLVIAWLAVGSRAYRAASVKPAEVLRYE
jgi:putative ABC transport system permease protein